MALYEIRRATPPPLAVTRRPRRGGAAAIHQIQLHATRGNTTLGRQVGATENWFGNRRNGVDSRGREKGWGSSADFVIGPDDRLGSKIAIVRFGNWLTTYGSWSAGFGGGGPGVEYGAAEFGVAIEIAQAPRMQDGVYQSGDSDQPFGAATVSAVVWLCDHINAELDRAGVPMVPAVHIEDWDQRLTKPIPRGYIGHEELANGHKLGKSDPGRMWDWPGFIGSLGLVGEETKAPPLPPKLSRIEAVWAVYRGGTVPVRRDGDYGVYEFRRRIP